MVISRFTIVIITMIMLVKVMMKDDWDDDK